MVRVEQRELQTLLPEGLPVLDRVDVAGSLPRVQCGAGGQTSPLVGRECLAASHLRRRKHVAPRVGGRRHQALDAFSRQVALVRRLVGVFGLPGTGLTQGQVDPTLLPGHLDGIGQVFP